MCAYFPDCLKQLKKVVWQNVQQNVKHLLKYVLQFVQPGVKHWNCHTRFYKLGHNPSRTRFPSRINFAKKTLTIFCQRGTLRKQCLTFVRQLVRNCLTFVGQLARHCMTFVGQIVWQRVKNVTYTLRESVYVTPLEMFAAKNPFSQIQATVSQPEWTFQSMILIIIKRTFRKAANMTPKMGKENVWQGVQRDVKRAHIYGIGHIYMCVCVALCAICFAQSADFVRAQVHSRGAERFSMFSGFREPF